MLQHFPFSTWYANQKQVSKQAHSRSQAIDPDGYGTFGDAFWPFKRRTKLRLIFTAIV